MSISVKKSKIAQQAEDTLKKAVKSAIAEHKRKGVEVVVRKIDVS